MREPTKLQLELLNALNPFREDANETLEEAAKELNTTKSALQERMKRLKKRCPEVYERFRDLRKKFTEDKRKIANPILLDPKNIEELERRGKIVEIF